MNGKAEIEEKHWIKRDWPGQVLRTPGQKDITNSALVEPSDIILPSLHIELGLMKQFVKALDKQGICLQYIAEKFPNLNAEKVKEGIFLDPQFRRLVTDELFQTTMNEIKRNARESFKEVVSNFLGIGNAQITKALLEKC